MELSELLKHCKYYKGEDKCPAELINKRSFWDYESVWVQSVMGGDTEFLNVMEEEMIGLAHNLGEKDPKTIDPEKPFALIAILFNRWGYWCNDCHLSYKGVINDFEKWYKRYYTGE